ncbi:MAG: hypothetical protein KIT79_09475 [Deltaproteobacteria bacterium]|nr:hypothetical protein [Deltaproteobacteria bacterium]
MSLRKNLCDFRLFIVLAIALHGAGAAVHAADGTVRFLAGPKSRGAPDDLESELTAFLADACCSLDILVQEWDHPELARALIDRVRGLSTHRRRLKVRVVVEMDYLLAKAPLPETGGSRPGVTAGIGPEVLPDSLDVNRQIISDFWRAGIDIRPDYNPAIFHHKFVVRDYGLKNEAVWTGSMNFTRTDARVNFNNAVIITGPQIVRAYRTKFMEAWSGAFGRRVKRQPKLPGWVELSGGSRNRVLFTPASDAESELVAMVDGATEEVRFAIFTFSESSALTDAVIRAARRGVRCIGLFDAGQAGQSWSPDERIEEAGCEVLRSPPPGKLHHKFLVVDGRRLATGSFNYTRPANELNDENVYFADSGPLADAAVAEHERLRRDFGSKKAKPGRKRTKPSVQRQ